MFFTVFVLSCELNPEISPDDKKNFEIVKWEAALPESIDLYRSYVLAGKAVNTPRMRVKLSDGSICDVYSRTEFVTPVYKAEYYKELKSLLIDHGIKPATIVGMETKKAVEYADHYIFPGGVGAVVECRWEWAFPFFTTYRKLFFQFDDSHKFYRLRMLHRRTSTSFHIFVDSNSTVYDRTWGTGQSSVDAHCNWRFAWDNPWWDYDIKVWYKVNGKNYYKEIYHRK